jgi:hypothetical protein
MAARQKAAMLGIMAVVGTLIVSPALNRPATPQKQAVVAPKAQPAPKASVPAQRTQPVPRPRPPAAITRPERKAKAKKQPKRVAVQQGGPSASQCARLRSGINQYGLSIVQAGARVRGYSDDQFNTARQRCGV